MKKGYLVMIMKRGEREGRKKGRRARHVKPEGGKLRGFGLRLPNNNKRLTRP